MAESSPDVPELPEVTEAMRADARANPNTWLYVIDPAFSPDADVPSWGVVGAYQVDEHGQIRETTFRPNPEYRPSPTALRMPPASNELEGLLQLVKTGHREQAELLPAVLSASLLIYAASAEDQSVSGFPDPTGEVLVPACTSAAQVPSRWPGWREITGRELVSLLHGHPLVLNPTGPITAVIPAEHLVAAAGDPSS